MFAACAGRDFLSRRDLAILRVFFDTGARLTEIASLAVEDATSIWTSSTSSASAGVPVRAVRRQDRPGDHTVSAPAGRETGSPTTRSYGSASTQTARWPRAGVIRVIQRRARQAGVQGMHPHRLRHTLAHNWQLNHGNERPDADHGLEVVGDAAPLWRQRRRRTCPPVAPLAEPR